MFGLTLIPDRSYCSIGGSFRLGRDDRGAGNVGGGRGPFQKDASLMVRTRLLPAVAVGVLLTVGVPGTSLSQAVAVSEEPETFRKTPGGRELGEVLPGARLAQVRSEGEWAEVTLDGWIPTSSLASTTREGFDRVVSRVGGETLRVRPDGQAIARLLQGFLLDRVEERNGWTRVRRSGWVRAVAVSPAGLGSFARPAVDSADRPPALVTEGRRLEVGEGPVGLREAPGAGGDTVAIVSPGTGMVVLDRTDGWTRVRVDGWARSEELVTQDPDSVLADVSAAALRASPDEYRGRKVRWSVQFVALERAEPERTDFYEGEPFILARAPDPGEGFVYLAVPPELLPDVEGLRPLQRIDVLGQVRTGRSTLMGVPILDLLALF